MLHAARALQPTTGKVVAPAYVLVEGERIVSVGTTAPTPSTPPAPGTPTATEVVELGDATILPGLVDAHSHLLSAQGPEESAIVTEVATTSDADRALRAVRFAKQMVRAGFTTVRDLGNSGHGADVSLKRAIRSGIVEGPSMVVSTRALAPPGGQFPRLTEAAADLVDHEYAVVKSPDEARASVTRAFYEGADCIKVIVDHGPGRSLDRETLEAIVATAHAAGRKVAAHALEDKAARAAIAAGVDSIEHGYSLSDATLSEMAKKKISLVATDYPLTHYLGFVPAGPAHDAVLEALTKFHASNVERLRRAKKANVTIVAGSDAYVETPAGDRGCEALLVFRAYAEAGLSPLEIVRSATVNAAALLGRPPGTSSMEPGSIADILVVEGDPLADPSALERTAAVFLAGRRVELER